MAQRMPVSILIVNSYPQDVKLIAVGLRGFFSDCRIDVAYSAQEARVLSQTYATEWTLIVVDDDCLSGDDQGLIEDLKRQASHASLILQTNQPGTAVAAQAMQAGADFLLSKQSPAFLAEILFCARQALEKLEIKTAAAHMEARYQHLLAAMPDIFYELNAEGQFVALGPNVSVLLGYAPEELVGAPYTTVFSPKDQTAAIFRFNERRSGSRSIHGTELIFRGKPSPDQPEKAVSAEVRARGLYDPHRRFLGTIGIIRNLPSDRAERGPVPDSTADEPTGGDVPQSVTVHQLISLSEEIAGPLETLRQETQALLDTVRSAGLEDKLAGLVEQSLAAATLRNRLIDLMRTTADRTEAGHGIHDFLEEALASLSVRSTWPFAVTTDYAFQLPLIRCDHAQVVECLRQLLLAVRTMLLAAGRPCSLLIRTTPVGREAEGSGPLLFSLPPPNEIEIECRESEALQAEQAGGTTRSNTPDIVDWPTLYGLVSSLSGRLDISIPATGPVRVLLHLPVIAGAPEAGTVESIPVSPPQVEDRRPLSGEPQSPTHITQAPHQRDVADRRGTPRVVTALPSRVMIGSAVWHGTLVNLGQGGACVALASDFPAFDQQTIRVMLRTSIGTLELAGSAMPRQTIAPAKSQGRSPVRLILIFEPPSDSDSSVLASFVEAAREQSLSFSLDVQLTSTAADRPSPSSYGDDRREIVRVPLVLPARLDADPLIGQDRLIARVVDISRQGACLIVNAGPDRLRGSMLLHFASGKIASHSGHHEPGAPDFSLPVRIVWSAPDGAASSEFRPSQGFLATRVGVGFLPLTPYAERELARLVRQHLSAPTRAQLHGETSIVSVQRECRTARGQTLVIIDDHLERPMASDTPVLIIAPGYGQTARDYAVLSYFMLRHGLRVLRYDHSNHLGQSDGELQNTTLRGAQADLAKVVEFVHHTWPSSRVVVLASDLIARAALKMTVQTHPLDLLMLLNPVVDVGAALMAVHGHDLIADYRYGLRRGITNLLGLNVNLDQFLADAIAGRMTDLGSTLEDIRLLHSPLAIITGPRNEASPLPPSDLPHDFLGALGSQTGIISIPMSIAGRFYADETDSAAAFQKIFEHIMVALPWQPLSTDLISATPEMLARQLRLELEQTRLHRNLSQINRDALRLAHLQQLPHLANLHEYRKLLDDLHAFLTPLSPDTIVLDAGVGQSDMTRTILVNHSYWTRQRGQSPEQAPLLIGLGRGMDQLRQARHHTSTLQRELASGKSGGLTSIPAMRCAWMSADWTQSLPFRSQCIHRIVCNFSLSFVNSPHATLREWMRILHPQGRLVFTTFHPDTDLSTLYRRHLRLANVDEFGAQPQGVLHYLGRLHEALRHGILHAFDHNSLASLLRQSGAHPFRINSIFNGQALVAVVGKRISSSSF